MVKFLTTQGLNYYLEELLKNANSKITLISPYFKLQRRIKEILSEKKQQGVEIIFVCRANDLQEPLNEFSTQIFDAPTLHAKCYMNENEAILTSLNLYEFSQQNNEEMGVYVTNDGDGSAMYTDILLEANRLSKNTVAPSTPTIEFDHRSEEKLKSEKESPFEIGIKYSAVQLQSIFNFSYQGRAGIKDSSTGDIVLFSNIGPTPYDDKQENQVIYYQGQNTGDGSQKLIYGNKLLYEAYNKTSVKIYFFKNYTYCGEFEIIQKPYMENGKWIFPIAQK
ncbi:phospholipase D family protein [Desulforhopalus vacuolatus]|uniref:phospholipase D family protein n=1 Tax=Desulforhopalus vacuolatus TaxID=40414 RepID=UPI001963F50C|nr:phospholipase D family protein [Desulforhopalus vacuolatus]MBM9521268.1 phospholipase D family protein [Desulforhopalus vacuolatus]